MRRRVSAVAFAVAAVVPLLGGCGIQETDVIEAGGPASVQAFFDREYEMLLFLRSPDGGLSPVIRTTKPSAGFGGEYDEPGSGDENAGDQNAGDQTPATRRDPYRRRRSSWRCSPVPGRRTGPRAWAPPSPRPAPARPSRSAPPRPAGSRPACPSP
jgi:hypothetical protein